MRIFPGFVSQRAGLQHSALSIALTLSAALSVTCVVSSVRPSVASASGPVERMVQVLLSPADPNVVVVRWGVASEGYLFSKDGGRSFKAMCSTAIDPDPNDQIKQLSGKTIPGAAATLIDTHGKLVVSQIGGLWTDDGTGCGWTKQLDGQWPYSVIRDPKNPDELIAVVNTHTDSDAQSHLMRRDADGTTWSQLGALLPALPEQHAYGGDLIASATATGTQLYASINVTKGALSAMSVENSVIVGSTDGGKTWSEGFTQPSSQEDLTLLAIDPGNPRRILATIYRDNAADTLMLSQDQGKTFSAYQDVRETTGVTFGPDGRLYVSDAGDSTGSDQIGGLWTAAKLGDPLTLVNNTSLLDCATFDPTSGKLFACKRDKVGLLDPVSGQFDQLVEIDTVPALIDCPGVDMPAVCKAQLNAGASWCCAGHYPFTPFCGQYDVTTGSNGQVLYCGLSGRIFDQMSGRGPADAGVGSLDAGSASNGKDAASEHDAKASVGDAGTDTTPTPKSGGDGCSIAVHNTPRSFGGPLIGLSIALIALRRSLRRRRR